MVVRHGRGVRRTGAVAARLDGNRGRMGDVSVMRARRGRRGVLCWLLRGRRGGGGRV